MQTLDEHHISVTCLRGGKRGLVSGWRGVFEGGGGYLLAAMPHPLSEVSCLPTLLLYPEIQGGPIRENILISESSKMLKFFFAFFMIIWLC